MSDRWMLSSEKTLELPHQDLEEAFEGVPPLATAVANSSLRNGGQPPPVPVFSGED